MAQTLSKAISFEPSAFNIHSKGCGLICNRQTGIRKNEFVVEYFGEIYRPYRWFEKQDIIKKFMKEKNLSHELLDFYNIMIERHKNDPAGYDMLFVDPIHKGNFSSRLSHSCDPNCGTITTICDGQYVIGIFALKDIEFGEELTFDYCSVTEDANEMKKALCLCGTSCCRAYYLDLSKSKETNKVLEENHNFLHRNWIILKACAKPQIDSEDLALLEKHKLKSSVLHELPDWLKKWSCLTLQFIEKEKLLLREEFAKEKMSDLVVDVRVNDVYESRIQNLVITLDKIANILKLMKEQMAPLVNFTSEQAVENLFISKESVVEEMLALYLPYSSIHMALKAFVESVKKEIAKLEDSKEKLFVVKLAFLWLSERAKQFPELKLHKQAISDTLYMYAFTNTYFGAFEYKGVNSLPVNIRVCDLCNPESYLRESIPSHSDSNSIEKESRVLTRDSKVYRQQFIWGQLVGWFKQTVNNPEASLSQDRRGTLSYPSFEASFKTGDPKSLAYPFQRSLLSARKDFLKHLVEKPAVNWPPKDVKWSFKNTQKCYGTVLFESVVREDNPGFLASVIEGINLSFSEKLALFFKLESANEFLRESLMQLALQWESDFSCDISNENATLNEETCKESRKRVKRN